MDANMQHPTSAELYLVQCSVGDFTVLRFRDEDSNMDIFLSQREVETLSSALSDAVAGGQHLTAGTKPFWPRSSDADHAEGLEMNAYRDGLLKEECCHEQNRRHDAQLEEEGQC